MQSVYLDYSATTPVDRRILEKMTPWFGINFGNASSIHSYGRTAREAVERARERIAQTIRAQPEEIYFTSGGTEADNWALTGAARANREQGEHIVTVVTEHHAVLHTCAALEREGFDVTYLPVDTDGMLDPDDVRKAMRPETILVSVMHVNNEIGVIQDIEAIGAAVKGHGALFHTDAVQSFGRIPVDVNAMNVDLLTASAHKIYGPKGAGALYVRKGTKIERLLHGGSHERDMRAGTENVPAIVGFGAAAKMCRREMEHERDTVARLRDRFWQRIRKEIPDSWMNGHPEKRIAHNLNVSFKEADGESILLSLDLRGVAASSGSACTAGGIEPSHVIKATGTPEGFGDSAIRFTLGKYTTQQEIDYTVDVLKEIVERIRSL